MIDKDIVLKTYLELKNVIYVEKDKNGNIIYPTLDKDLEIYNELLNDNIVHNTNQYYHKGSKTWYQLFSKDIKQDNEGDYHTIHFLEDITSFKNEEKKLKIDALTHLLKDRNETSSLMNNYIEWAIKNKENFSIIMTDVDDFKKINDTYGHKCGDLVLQEIGKILIANTRHANDWFADRKSDIVTRFGGDEFLLLIKNMSLKDTEKKINEIKESMAKDCVQLDNNEFNIKMSFGYVNIDPTTLDTSKKTDEIRNMLIKKADINLYQAKKNK